MAMATRIGRQAVSLLLLFAGFEASVAQTYPSHSMPEINVIRWTNHNHRDTIEMIPTCSDGQDPIKSEEPWRGGIYQSNPKPLKCPGGGRIQALTRRRWSDDVNRDTYEWKVRCDTGTSGWFTEFKAGTNKSDEMTVECGNHYIVGLTLKRFVLQSQTRDIYSIVGICSNGSHPESNDWQPGVLNDTITYACPPTQLQYPKDTVSSIVFDRWSSTKGIYGLNLACSVGQAQSFITEMLATPTRPGLKTTLPRVECPLNGRMLGLARRRWSSSTMDAYDWQLICDTGRSAWVNDTHPGTDRSPVLESICQPPLFATGVHMQRLATSARHVYDVEIACGSFAGAVMLTNSETYRAGTRTEVNKYQCMLPTGAPTASPSTSPTDAPSPKSLSVAPTLKPTPPPAFFAASSRATVATCGTIGQGTTGPLLMQTSACPDACCCQKLCDWDLSCEAWEYRHDDSDPNYGRCYLKSTAGTGMVPRPVATSGLSKPGVTCAFTADDAILWAGLDGRQLDITSGENNDVQLRTVSDVKYVRFPAYPGATLSIKAWNAESDGCSTGGLLLACNSTSIDWNLHSSDPLRWLAYGADVDRDPSSRWNLNNALETESLAKLGFEPPCTSFAPFARGKIPATPTLTKIWPANGKQYAWFVTTAKATSSPTEYPTWGPTQLPTSRNPTTLNPTETPTTWTPSTSPTKNPTFLLHNYEGGYRRCIYHPQDNINRGQGTCPSYLEQRILR